MKISEVMTPDPACCAMDDTAQTAAIVMRELNIGIIPVVDNEENNHLVGVVTDRDLCVDVIAEGLNPNSVLLANCMITEVICCRADEDTDAALRLMQEYQVRRIPVVDDNNRITGIVSTADMVLCGEIDPQIIDETLRDICEPTAEEFEHLAELASIDRNNGNRLMDSGALDTKGAR